MSTLYLVATPIGNLEDITLRALRILREVTLIAAEDTRHSGLLLKHFDIATPLTSYHEYSDDGKTQHIIAALAGGDVALISDAGTPAISDPGYKLVRAALDAGHIVSPIPGPSAVIAAVSASGLPTDRFLFVGFLPAKAGARQSAVAELAALPYTLVFYEAPNRLTATLAALADALGDRAVCVTRELTKLHEELWRGSLRAAHAYFAAQERVRGELTLVVAGAQADAAVWDEAAVRVAFAALLAQGLARGTAAADIAGRSGWRKRQVYALDI